MPDKAVSPRAIEDARQWGLYGDTEARLRRMSRRSVPVPGHKYVRRFMNWELIFNNTHMIGVERLEI